MSEINQYLSNVSRLINCKLFYQLLYVHIIGISSCSNSPLTIEEYIESKNKVDYFDSISQFEGRSIYFKDESWLVYDKYQYNLDDGIGYILDGKLQHQIRNNYKTIIIDSILNETFFSFHTTDSLNSFYCYGNGFFSNDSLRYFEIYSFSDDNSLFKEILTLFALQNTQQKHPESSRYAGLSGLSAERMNPGN